MHSSLIPPHPNFKVRDCLENTAGLSGALRRYLCSQDPDFEILRVIRDKYPRLVMRVRVRDRDCLVKAVRKNTPWKRPGRYFRFQKEIFVYTRLQNLDFLFFRHPELLHTDGKSYIISEYIQDDPSLPKDPAFFSRAIKAVAELNACDFPYADKGGPGWFWEKFNRWKFSRTTKTLRNLMEGFFIRRTVSVSVFVRSLAFWRKAAAGVKALDKPVLLHRDVFKANILYSHLDGINFIDFEKAGLEKRWIFSDALKIAQAEPLYFSQDAGGYAGFPRFYTSLLENYWNEFKIRRPGFKPGPDDYKMQQKFCLLGWTLKKLVKERPS
ncbi:MAG: phosphotransferase, partial [Desulfonatronovibrio sp.]